MRSFLQSRKRIITGFCAATERRDKCTSVKHDKLQSSEFFENATHFKIAIAILK